jgi:uncharacterized protein YkwD
MTEALKVTQANKELRLGKRIMNIRTTEAATHMQIAKLNYAEVEGIYSANSVNPLDVRQLERFLFLLINNDRINNKFYKETKGLAQRLMWHESAAQIARNYSWDMAMRNYFSHFNPEGFTVAERLNRTRIEWSAVGENIAIGDDAVGIHLGFMSEQPFEQNHRANILSAQFTHCGIGIIRPADGLFFVSEIFLRLK